MLLRMNARKLQQLKADLLRFVEDVAADIGRRERKHWCMTYLRGLLLDGARKSVEPMASRLSAIDEPTKDEVQALQQFVNQRNWEDSLVLKNMRQRVGRQLGGEGVLIIDDTGFPKQGKHSVGVARQYSGTLGKVGNCQIAVTLQYQVDRSVACIDADTDQARVPERQPMGRPPTRPPVVRLHAVETESVAQRAASRQKAFRKVTWRQGSNGPMSSRFTVWRVRHAHRTSAGAMPQDACWLIAEWPRNEAAPTKCSFSNLPEETSRRDLFRLAKRRWWVEHSYRELKDELGLDHFEGRSWRGWHHHVTLTMLAYLFLVEIRLKLGKKGLAA
jgi:SRSO17 transposase